MTQDDDPLQPSQLDLTSESEWSRRPVASSKSGHQASPARSKTRVRLFFGCCKIFADLMPPKHVLQGESDVWRAHCPRCGELIEILFE